jgi:hypothetical protein
MRKITLPRMNKFEKIVKGGYEQYLPLVNHVVNQVQNIPDTMLDPFREWLQTNTPADYQPQVDGSAGTKQVQRSGPPKNANEP